MKTRTIASIAFMLSFSVSLCLRGEPLQAQKAKAPATPASPTGISIGLPFYGVDDAMRLKIRDLEYRSDQLEIEIQRMKVKIEEDKAAQGAIWKDIGAAAAKYAQDHAIDPDRNDFDAAEVKYVQKRNVPLIPATLAPEKEKERGR